MTSKVFRDPVHNLIAFEGASCPLLALVDTPEMQRLRRIRQLGMASLAYPTAEHSRFSHSLGAYHVAKRMLAQLSAEPPAGAPRPYLDDETVTRAVLVAALLHDVGHGPFSHLFERAFGGQVAHEEWSRRLVLGDGPLGAAVRALGADIGPAAAAIWRHELSPAFARKVVSSQLDADRMDYLLRDSQLIGVRYGLFDLDWVLRSLVVAEVAPGEWDVAVDGRRGIQAVEQFLHGRWYMYQQVYYHKSIRAAETMILSILARYREAVRAASGGGPGAGPAGTPALRKLALGETITTGEYLSLDDAVLTVLMASWAEDGHGGDRVLADLSHRLLERRLFKTIELAGVAPEARAGVERDVWTLARRRFGDAAAAYVMFDRAEGLAYDTVPEEEVWVIGRGPDPVPLDTVSASLAGSTIRAPLSHRLVIAPELKDEARAVVERARPR